MKKNLRLKRKKDYAKVPKSVQKVIPIKRVYEDGIFELEDNKFSRTYKFTDVNYSVAGQEDKERIFLGYSSILNLLDSSSLPKLTIINRKLNKIDFDNNIKLPLDDDELSKYRKEFNKILSQNSIDSRGMIQEKIITITVTKKSIQEARNYFSRIGTELANNFRKLGSKFTEIDLNERLRICYDFYRSGEEDLYDFNLDNFMKKGHSFKDYICPDTMEFKKDYFKLGEKYR